MPRSARRIRRRRRSKRGAFSRLLWLVAAIPALYLAAALAGSLIPVNAGWEEPDDGILVYLANNGVHADIVMPVVASGLDWRTVLAPSDVGSPPAGAQWVAFGSGEEKVYLDTPRWSDITPATIWSALTGGRRVMHVEWIATPRHATRAIRLRPDEYRRLWSAIRSDFDQGSSSRPVPIDHPGYGCCDGFYWATGRFNALKTCNSWAASRLRLAGIETSLWPPFVQGLVWRYRQADHST